MSEHTPTPWTNSCFQVYGADKSRIAHTGMGQLPPCRSTESEANADFIVKAVNSHDALVKALELSRKEIVRQHDKCGADNQAAAYFSDLLTKIDVAIGAPQPPAPITTEQLVLVGGREELTYRIEAILNDNLSIDLADEEIIGIGPACYAIADLAISPPVTTEPIIIDIEAGARAIAITRGHDPDDLAPRTEMCTHDTQQVPWWKVFEEEASACLRTISPVTTDRAAVIATDDDWEERGAAAELRAAVLEECAKVIENTMILVDDYNDYDDVRARDARIAKAIRALADAKEEVTKP